MKIAFVSLGCDKNLTDSETMLGLLSENGHTIINEEENADIIIVNTCCFINDAKTESIETILEMSEYKKYGTCKGLIVTGCMAQRYKEDILKEIPEVDALLGTASTNDIVKVIDELDPNVKPMHFTEFGKEEKSHTKRLLTTGGHFAYLKIAEGCDKHCTYCIIPSLRGNYRSVAMEDLLEEAASLVEGGIKELILVAQETTLYGTDLYGKKMLPELLRKLAALEDLKWIRILYCYPEEITDELIEVIKTEPKVCHYLDIPIQHGSNDILKRMGRRTSKEDIVDMVAKLRREVPDIALRTTLITGFPGETEENHKELMDFVHDMRFERLGVFTYSKEEDTPAAKLKPQVLAKVKKQRQKDLMRLQQQIAFEKAKENIGREMDVFVEGKITEEENVYIGRTYMDAPNVDGYIFITCPFELMSGDFVKVKVTGAKNYDLIGELVEE